MKKIGIIMIVAVLAGATLAAQPAPMPFGPQNRFMTPTATPAQTIKVEGKLALINGVIALKSGTETYYVPMIGRIAGFIEGVKEDASVKLEGYEFPIAAAPEYATLTVTKLGVGGKDYDLGQFGGFGTGFNHHGGMKRGGRW